MADFTLGELTSGREPVLIDSIQFRRRTPPPVTEAVEADINALGLRMGPVFGLASEQGEPLFHASVRASDDGGIDWTIVWDTPPTGEAPADVIAKSEAVGGAAGLAERLRLLWASQTETVPKKNVIAVNYMIPGSGLPTALRGRRRRVGAKMLRTKAMLLEVVDGQALTGITIVHISKKQPDMVTALGHYDGQWPDVRELEKRIWLEFNSILASSPGAK